MNKTTPARWLSEHADIRHLQAAVNDQNGNWRGKRVPVEQLDKLLAGELRLPISICNLDIWGADIENSPLVFASGDADGQCHWTGRSPLLMPWAAQPTALVPLTLHQDNGQPFLGDPRQVLSHILQRYHDAQLRPVVAFELEFYLARMNDGQLQAPHYPLSAVPFPEESIYSLRELEQFEEFLQAVNSACAEQDVPMDTALGESGAGQFEVNLKHGADPLKAADDAVFLKRIIKGVAQQFDYIATFMAKPYAELAGSGMHVHFSLLNADDQNVFGGNDESNTGTLQHAVGGLLDALADSTALLAPHLNSYRRLQPNAHAPAQVTWGFENRTTAIRIPGGSSDNRRIEHRVAGADANPYLVLATILSAAFNGIQNKTTPPAPVTGNAYQTDATRLPDDWQTALTRLAQSNTLQQTLPEKFITLFLATKHQELKRLTQHMSSFELHTYLENT